MGGIFAVALKENCADALFYGTDYQTHMGPDYGGMAIEGTRPQIRTIEGGQFKDKFSDYHKRMREMKQRARYGLGAIGDTEQPLICHSHHGTYVLATTGRMFNEEKLARKLIDKHKSSFTEVSTKRSEDSPEPTTVFNPTEIASNLINLGGDFEEGVRILREEMEGSLSGVIMKEGHGIYAFSGEHAHWPLALGSSSDGWAVTTETCAFPNLGFRTKKYMKPGEMVHFNQSGVSTLIEGHDNSQVCTFLWVYTGFPASSYYEINAGEARKRCGAALARRDIVKADMSAAVPDSGVFHAIGYGQESGIPFDMPLTKYTPGYGRSYTPPTQELRDLVAELKLIPILEMIEGKKIVTLEDSIVRGTQLRNKTLGKMFILSGADEAHIRPACPPLMFPCKYGKSTRDVTELVARRAIADIHGNHLEDGEIRELGYLDPESKNYGIMIRWIRDDLDLEVRVGDRRMTLMYQRLDDMVEAIGMPKGKLCTHCWNGDGV